MEYLTRRQMAGGLVASVGLSALGPDMALAKPYDPPNIALPKDLVANSPTTTTHVATDRPYLAMTFDDGPHPVNTPRLLDMLKSRKIKATFYCIGWRVNKWPQIVQRIMAEGHEVGNHTYKHPFLTKLGPRGVLYEMDSTTSAIHKATGRLPLTMRPPYGAFSAKQRTMLHDARALPTILWSVDPADWRRPGASVVASRIVKNAHPGAIILSHDIHKPTIDAMPAAFDALLAKGYQFKTVSEMLGWGDWSNSRRQRVMIRAMARATAA